MKHLMIASFLAVLQGVAQAAGVAAAAEGAIDLQIENPTTLALKARMSARAEKIEPLKKSAAVGEALTGLLEQRSGPGLGLDEKKHIRDLVVAENEDRTALFREIALAHKLQDSGLPAVAAAFAKWQRRRAAPEHWVQHPRTREWVERKEVRE